MRSNILPVRRRRTSRASRASACRLAEEPKGGGSQIVAMDDNGGPKSHGRQRPANFGERRPKLAGTAQSHAVSDWSGLGPCRVRLVRIRPNYGRVRADSALYGRLHPALASLRNELWPTLRSPPCAGKFRGGNSRNLSSWRSIWGAARALLGFRSKASSKVCSEVRA